MRRSGDLRHVLVLRPADFERWSSQFVSACIRAVDGDRAGARRALLDFDGDAVTNWYHYVAQNAGKDRLDLLRLVLPGHATSRSSAPSGRATARMPGARALAEIYRRDRYRCRYCHGPVLPKKAIARLSDVTGVDLRKARTNLQTHGAHWLHCATVDHVDPHSAGGSTDDGNLVTSCYACQFGKGAHSLGDLGLVLRSSPADLIVRRRSWTSTAAALGGATG